MGQGKKKRNKDKRHFYEIKEDPENRNPKSHEAYRLIREYIKSKNMLKTSDTVFEEILNYYPLNEIGDGDTLNKFLIELLDKAITITKEDSRKTVQGRDIFLAKKEMEMIKKDKERENKKRTEFKNRLPKIENLIHEMQYSKAAIELRVIKKIVEHSDLNNIASWVEKNLNFCETIKIKRTVLDLGTKFARLQIAEISEVCDVKDEKLIIVVVKEMIINNEIYAQYFSSTKSVAFNQQANIDEIDKLMETYEVWGNKRFEKI